MQRNVGTVVSLLALSMFGYSLLFSGTPRFQWGITFWCSIFTFSLAAGPLVWNCWSNKTSFLNIIASIAGMAFFLGLSVFITKRAYDLDCWDDAFSNALTLSLSSWPGHHEGNVAGIKWNPMYVDDRVVLINKTGRILKDLQIELKADAQFEKIGSIGPTQAYFEAPMQATMDSPMEIGIQTPTGLKVQTITPSGSPENILVETDRYRISVPQIAPYAALQIVLASYPFRRFVDKSPNDQSAQQLVPNKIRDVRLKVSFSAPADPREESSALHTVELKADL